jgi:uncharacterized protein YkwD
MVAAAAGGGTAAGGIDPARRAALAQGALPTTAAEQQWVAQASTAMASMAGAVQALVGEAQRQAALGRDVYGRPLQGAEDHQFEQRVLDLVNAERAKYGAQPLAYDRQLDLASERHNQVQAATGRMAHDGIGDGTPRDRIRATGFTGAWGENVATGQLSPEQVVAEWMASPGHRRNILDPTYDRLGVSYTVASNGRTFWAQSFGTS